MLELPAKRVSTEPVERVPVLKIGEQVFTRPAKLDASVGAAYLLDVATIGDMQAGAKLFLHVVGRDALQALATYEGLTSEEFEAVIKEVTTVALGQMETSSGN